MTQVLSCPDQTTFQYWYADKVGLLDRFVGTTAGLASIPACRGDCVHDTKLGISVITNHDICCIPAGQLPKKLALGHIG